MESSGHSNDHWEMSITLFTSLFFVVNNKILTTTQYFHPAFVWSIVGTVLFYFAYLYISDPMKDLVMQHYTFYRLFSSPLFYVTCMLPIMICFYLDMLIQAVIVLLLTDPQNLIRINLKQIRETQEFSEYFLEQFKELTEIQQRFLVIDNYFREEQLEILRLKTIQMNLQETSEGFDIANELYQ